MKNRWNGIWKSKTGLTDYEIKWYGFLEKFSLRKNVLEIGCGTGRGLKNFRNGVTGLDFSSEALGRARKELAGKKVKLVKGDARKLPFDDGEFDFVFSSGLLEHFKNDKNEDKKILDEHVRVARKGGTVMISVPNTFSVWYILVKSVMYLLEKYPYPEEKSYNIFELEKMLRERGVKNIRRCGLQLFPPSFTGWSRIYPKSLAALFDKIEAFLGRLCHPFCFAVVCWGEAPGR